MVITIMIVGNVVFGTLINQTWNYIKKTKNEINRYPTWAKATLILVNLLSLFGFVLQIISVVESERKIAMAMLLLACVLQFASGNMLKPKEKKDDD